MKTQKGALIYLYCVTKIKPANLKEAGIKTYSIYSQGLYAIVSKVSPDEFSEDKLKKKLANMEWVEERVRQHEKVIEEVMRETAVLPFKFAIVFNREENVRKQLEEQAAEFKKILSRLEGKAEWGLKIYCSLKKFKDTLAKEDKGLKEIDQEMATAGKGKAYFLKKKKDETIENILNQRISEYTQDSFDRLKRQSVETKINKLLHPEVTQKKERMVLNAVFLIEKKRIKEFDNILAYLKTKYENKGLEFYWTGPWPPYNFVSVK